MAKCDVCGNDYDKSFEVSGPRGRGTFDSLGMIPTDNLSPQKSRILLMLALTKTRAR